MRWLPAVPVAVVLLAGLCYAVPSGREIEFPGGAMGNVVFSGRRHAVMGVTCIDCHLSPFGIRARRPGESVISHEDHVPGRACGLCHDGKRAFPIDNPARCKRCHPEAPAPSENAQPQVPNAPAGGAEGTSGDN